jgi:hypothetical protein
MRPPQTEKDRRTDVRMRCHVYGSAHAYFPTAGREEICHRSHSLYGFVPETTQEKPCTESANELPNHSKAPA